MATKTVDEHAIEQTALPLSPDAPPDLEQVRIDVMSLVVRDEPKPNAALKRSVRNWGVLQAVLVHHHNGQNVVVDGNRRVLAARDADILKVPCLRTADLDYLKHVATIMLNETREKNPLAEWEAIDALLAKGHDAKAIATATGMAVGTIRKRMKLANLIPDVRAMAERGEIKAGVVEKLATLSHPEQRAVIDRASLDAVDEGSEKPPKVTLDDVKAVRSVANQTAMAELPMDLFTDPEPTADEIGDRLAALAGDFAAYALAHGYKLTTAVKFVRVAFQEREEAGGPAAHD